MSKVHIECPSCHAMLATSGRNVGKEGVCPQCDNTFDILSLGPKHATGSDDAGDGLSRGLALALAGGLVALALSTALPWAHITGSGPASILGQKAAVVAGSAACAIYILFAWFGRKSLIPAATVSAAWALGAGIWLSGTLSMLSAGEKILLNAAPQAARVVDMGIYCSIGAACIAFGLALGLVAQLRDSRTFRNVPAFLGGLLVVGLLAGILGVSWHVRPALSFTQARVTEAEPDPQQDPSEINSTNGHTSGQQTGNGNNQPPGDDDDDDDDDGPATPETLAIWIEGESSKSKDYFNYAWYDRQVKTEYLSGGDWKSHYHPTQTGSATWQFDAEREGEYTFWLRCNPVQATMTYSLNDGEPVDISVSDIKAGTHSIAPDEPDHRFIAWVRVDKVQLQKDRNKITITQDGGIAHSGGVDCMLFINSGWQPRGNGLTKPEVLQDAEED